jgi:hypothetical protein
LLLGLTCSSVALALLCFFLLEQNRNLKMSARSAPALPRFWQVFLAGGKPTNIVLPTPVYFAWQEDRLMVRDREISVYADWSKSPLLLELAKRWGPPTLDQRYVVAVHMFPAVSLLQYLERHGRQAQVVLSPRLAIDSYRDQNTIVVGGPRNTDRFQAFLDKRNFKIVSTNPTRIRNMNPRLGEPVEYGQSAQSNLRVTFPGIIATLPRSQEGTGTLLLIGNNPAALASMLLSAEGLKLLEDQWSLSGRPDAWEMVVQAEMHGETVLNVHPVGFRAVVKDVSK